MKLFLSILSGLIFTTIAYGQLNISLSPANDGQTFNTCNGFIIDSGGQGGTGYSNNESSVITICPDTPGEIISIDFNLFNLDGTNTGTQQNPNVDFMAVYDGTSTAANSLGVYTTNGLQGVFIEATALNATGCITLEFYSNGVGTGVFTASVACETPCNNPVAGGSIVGGITSDSIRVCLNEVVNFQEQGSFAQPGFSLVDYSWDFMDGTTATGQNVSHSWSVPGFYRVQLFVTDDNGCSNPNLIDLQVLVGTVPEFPAFPSDESICLGESATFSASAQGVLWSGFPGSQTVDDGCLPDTLLGVSQDIELIQTGFSAGTTITDVNDIESICLDLEHSFMGDLVIILECPNGQNVIMHQQGGGGTQIGIPVQADNVDCSDPSTIGTPFTYCFTPSATDTWVEWVAANGGGTIPAGDYESVQPLNNLVGCPTNGVWTLTVIDNWAADDGTLFSFGLTLDPSYYPDITTFEPVIGAQCDSSFWDSPQFQSAISPDCNQLTVTPTAPGSYTYTYSVTDDFGCTFDTSLVLTVDPLATVFAGNDTTLCNGAGLQLDGQIVGATSTCSYELILDDTFGDGWNGNTVTVTVNGVSTDYTLQNGSSITFNLQVPTGATVDVTFNANGNWVGECEYEILDENGVSVVQQGPNLAGVVTDSFSANCVPDYEYSWSPPAFVSDPTIPNPTVTVNGQQTLTLTINPVGSPLCASTDDILISISATPNPGNDNVLEVCSSGAPVDLFPLLGAMASPNGTWEDPQGNPVNMPYDPPSMPVGVYTYVVDSNGCVDQATITITEIITDITSVIPSDASCFGFADGEVTVSGNNIDSYSLNGAPPVAATSPFTITGLTAGNYALEVFSVDGCSAQDVFVIGEPDDLTGNFVSNDASCFGVCDGTVQVTIQGGTMPYVYNWNGQNGDQNGNASGLCAGNSSVSITDAQGCVLQVSYVVGEPAAVAPSIMGDVLNGCSPHTVNFTNTTGSGNIFTTEVDYGDGTSETVNGESPFSHTYELPGMYTVSIVITTNDGCVYDIVYNNLVVVYSNPIAEFVVNPENVSMLEPFVNLVDLSSPDVTGWNWIIPGGTPATSSSQNVSNVAYPFDTPGTNAVMLYVTNQYGCVDSIQKIVTIVNDVLLYAPNTFTPDGDEFNEEWTFYISGIDIYNFDLFIFNRWGEVIWESHDPSVGWSGVYNGKLVPDGTYTWTMRVSDASDDGRYTFNGHITVIR